MLASASLAVCFWNLCKELAATSPGRAAYWPDPSAQSTPPDLAACSCCLHHLLRAHAVPAQGCPSSPSYSGSGSCGCPAPGMYVGLFQRLRALTVPAQPCPPCLPHACSRRPDSCVRPAPGMFVTLFQALRDHACMVPASDMGTRKALGRHMTAARLMLKARRGWGSGDSMLVLPFLLSLCVWACMLLMFITTASV